MKRDFPRAWTTDFLFPFLLVVCAIISTFSADSARANEELDRQYALESIGVLRPWDNLDGLFAEYLRAAYKEYFAGQGRYKLQDISQADPVLLNSKIPYSKLVEDKDVLTQLARSLRAESLIRTKVYKEGHHYRFVLDWLHSADMQVLATQEFVLNEPEPGKSIEPYDLSLDLRHAIDSLFAKLPFNGMVTGRDREWVTVSMNPSIKLRAGDQLVLSTIEEVRKHPILGTIVEWKMSESGRLEVDQIDGNVAFAKILSEKSELPIARYQKVTRVFAAPEAPIVVTKDQDVQEEMSRKLYEPPKLGWVSGGAWLGPYDREASAAGTTAGVSGGGLVLGAQADLQLWLTRNIFTDLGFGYGFYKFSQQFTQSGANTPGGTVSGTSTRFDLDVGYSYLVTGDFWGPKFWGKIGYHNFSYTQPDSATEQTGSMSYGSLFLGIGGEIPVRDEWGGLFWLNLGVLKGSSVSGFSPGSSTSSSDVSFFIGGYYRFQPRVSVRLGLEMLTNSTDFSSGQTISNRIISFGPSVQYYF